MTIFDVKLYFIFAFISGVLAGILLVAITILIWSVIENKNEKNKNCK